MQNLVEKLKGYGSQLKAYERHISALAMIGGFVFDSFSYGRVDHAVTQTLLLVYIAVAAGTIIWLHFLESRPHLDGAFSTKLRGLLPAATQFAFGSLWSAFLVFYSRSGVLASSWPFFLILVAIFVGNEVFKSYHSRLIFTSVLLAFALLSYAIFMVPVFTHTIGEITFIGSGLTAAAVFLLFLRALDKLGQERWSSVRWPTLGGALAVFAAVYGLYFLDVLPPLPLAMQKAGVYTSVKHVGTLYYAQNEAQSWQTWFGAPVVVHADKGDPVFVFSAVFAPIKLATRVQHVWQRYDETEHEWVTVQKRSYEIVGGRENGFRGYTRRIGPRPGLWRVDVVSNDGRLIGRSEFKVVRGGAVAAQETTVIK
jgi:hypothetical protein